MGVSKRTSRLEAEKAHPIVLHAHPRSDIVCELKREKPVRELLEVQLVLVHLLREDRIDTLGDPALELLADLAQPVDLLVIAFNEFGEEARAQRRVGRERGEEGGEDREKVFRVFVGEGCRGLLFLLVAFAL